MVVKASAKSVRMSPRKIGVVAGLVRGRSVSDAITILEHTPRHASLPVKKVIESAKANAENNHNLQVATLVLSKISVTPGPRLKRWRPAAHGRALPYQKKSSHIFVEVEGEPKPPKKPAAKKTDKKKETK
ncbi:MAG TPA: 50S ribosomal protein L22 [Candidatus Saccharimonadales bacterium]|nr:50S ribosomal protein L22 [Candidatus Saccharimonadales bacterium]